MFRLRSHRFAAFGTLLVLFATHVPAGGQTRTSLAGTIRDQQTLRPLPGALVSLPDQGVRAEADRNGNFFFSEVPAGQLQVRIEAPQYATLTEDVAVPPGEVAFAQFHLLSMTAMLEGLVVTARRGGLDSSGGIDANEVRSKAGEERLSAAELIARRLPGVLVRENTNGAGGRILIRGMNSLTSSNEPAVFLNGIRISSRGNANTAFDVLNQIRASEVSRIQLVRGASAGSLYSDSANGSIFVETRSSVREQP